MSHQVSSHLTSILKQSSNLKANTTATVRCYSGSVGFVLKSNALKMVFLDQSKVDRAECTSSLEEEHHTSSPSHQDREQLRQELLGKVCLSSRVVQKPLVKTKEKISSKEATVEGDGTNELHSHDDDADAKPHRSRSKHSQRRAAKWRSQQQHQ